MAEIKCTYDPLTELIAYYAKDKGETKKTVETENLTVEEKLKRRIIDGDKIGVEKDLNYALKDYSAISIINDILLEGMKVVGELFGSGQMQLPFVLQSAECMKACVSFLEPFMEKSESESAKGTMVLATVKGDVHDIGKNLVDIILTNNGFKVINLGIKCPLENMLDAYEKESADVIGMSGLLVKSTAIMKENLEIMNDRSLEVPVILGGAALNKRFVEGELREMYRGDVYYANDAFDGLKFMDTIMEYKRKGERPPLAVYKDARTEEFKERREKKKTIVTGKSDVRTDADIPNPPFWGSRIVDGIPIEKAFEHINETALFKGSWNVYKDKNKPEEEYDKLIKEEIYPKFNELKLKAKRENLLTPKVIYGYFPCNSAGNDLIIYKPKNLSGESIYGSWNTDDVQKDNLEEWQRFSFPRQNGAKYLCISDFFRTVGSEHIDVVPFMIVTVGAKATEYAQKLYKENKYTDYLYFHGLSVETAEGLAEYWHRIIRKELGIGGLDSADLKKIFQQGYRGSRYSFGYPACPDLEDNKIIFELLKPERIGVTLTEEWQMVPEQTTNAIIVHHPEAKYFFIK
ncbi:MAG: B12-binding domain-containing protein [Bacteroidetes bacterium]|nr:B12-binding domain-containing protein [Bacteroidota bacterium]